MYLRLALHATEQAGPGEVLALSPPPLAVDLTEPGQFTDGTAHGKGLSSLDLTYDLEGHKSLLGRDCITFGLTGPATKPARLCWPGAFRGQVEPFVVRVYHN